MYFKFKYLYGLSIDFKNSIPPKLAAGKNFSNLHPWETAISISVGLETPGKKGRLLLIKKCETQWCKIQTGEFIGWVNVENVWGPTN